MQALITSSAYIIAAAYFVLAVGVGIVGILPATMWAKLSGALFFITCAITHMHIGYHVSLAEDVPYEELVGFVGLHYVFQALAAWGFIVALSRTSAKK